MQTNKKWPSLDRITNANVLSAEECLDHGSHGVVHRLEREHKMTVNVLISYNGCRLKLIVSRRLPVVYISTDNISFAKSVTAEHRD